MIYLYVCAAMTYGPLGTGRCKVGISKDPSRRPRQWSTTIGGFSVVKKWPFPDKKSAETAEKMVCKAFEPYHGREFLDKEADDVCDYIEKNIIGMPFNG